MAGLLKIWLLCAALLATAGCSAQPQAAPDLNLRLERQVRTQFRVPAFVEVEIGARKPSEFAGYDTLEVVLSDGTQRSTHEFLLSQDGNTLVRMTKMDISTDPYAQVMSKIDLTGRPSRGADAAKVVVVNFDDFQCPYCARMHETLFSDVMVDYRDRVRVVYKDFPLQPWARRAAINANCLLQQDAAAYWAYADTLHARHREITARQPAAARDAELDRLAGETATQRELDAARLADCIRRQPDDAVRASLEEGRALGVNATPTLFVNGMRVEGAIPAEELRAVLDRALREAGAAPARLTEAAVPAAPAE